MSRAWAGLSAVLLLSAPHPAAAQVERVWLTHRTTDASRLVVNWTTRAPGDSVVRYGPTADHGREVRVGGSRTLHHVEIPLTAGAATHYAVSTGDQGSADAVIPGYPADVLRVAVVANWQSKPDLSSLVKDAPHLLLTAGDNVPDLWHACGAGTAGCTNPYEALVDAYPALFRSTPFLPALGNHDREIRPRGPQPPADPVYDVGATAFRSFFPLPGDGWKWHLDLPAFRLRFVALDLNHTSDRGTTWQTCHDFGPESDQFRWYARLMAARPPGFVVTLFNERHATVRGLAGGAWVPHLRKGTVAVSGFGYFGERADAGGLPLWNTSLGGTGAKYPDPQSKGFWSVHNYLLLTADRKAGTLTAELKSLAGAVLDRQTYAAQPGTDPAAVSAAEKDADGFLVHRVRSAYQAGETQVRVLLPDDPEPGRRYPAVYVLPVEAGREGRYGDGLKEVQKLGLHNRYKAAFVAPTFSALPWYADHPTRPEVRQESYFLNVVLPLVENAYPVRTDAGGRLLLGFSKSGWGAYSLLLRHPDAFGRAAAWDAPLMLDRPGKYGSGNVFGTADNFAGYRVADLLATEAGRLRADPRLVLLGYGNFRADHQAAHALMRELGVAHEYRDGPARPHDWHSGWVADAVGLLLAGPAVRPAP